MQEHIDKIEALGARPLGISFAADYQAELLMKDQIGFELLLDPERNFKADALSMAKIKLWTYIKPSVMWRYLKWARKARQGKITAGLSEPPAVAIIDTKGVVRYLYKGETLGDYPPFDDVMAELRVIVAS